MLAVINPTTGRQEEEYGEMTLSETGAIVAAAHEAFLAWRRTSFQERAVLLRRVAAILHDNKETYARLMVKEMGKLLTAARDEVDKCAWCCLYFADQAEAFMRDEFVATDAAKSYITHQPLGVILAIMPWNFPFWQVFRFAAPALMAGNTALLKHAANVPGCAKAIEHVFREAGFPAHCFRSLMIQSEAVEPVIRNPLVRAVTLTGSEKAGRSVAAIAGSELKKTVMELGGSDPYLILKDADLDLAARMAAQSRLLNNGQSCIAAKRFIVVREVYDEFVSLFTERMRSARMGDPLREETGLGPLARFDLRETLHRQVLDSIDQGAGCILGGQIPDRDGAFYPATILTGVKKNMPAYGEELFGPVAAVLGAVDEEEAVLLANDTGYGLGAAVFTRDEARGERLAREKLEAGSCFVNGMVKSDPRLPFGGIRNSGYGRELSHYGMKEFVNVKTVYVA
jgi:succinate-semialdehyde dehydrogenase / glutarate-semialdehyde dehydrogenase